ncbi:MAG: glycoside hydrolase family 2 protein, partial [Treponema sp.]|nr:glycoside hydrolase family 2 protein [Treponema sp.]
MKSLFNSGWQFAKEHIENKTASDGSPILYGPDEFYQNAAKLQYQPVELPHDYLIFQTNDLYENSVGFYRKSFSLQALTARTALRFEGVYMNAGLWVNGRKAFEWKYGYTAFEADISPFVQEGENCIELVCVYQNPNSRWYSGAGIYRDVYLIQSGLPFLVSDGIYFSAKKLEDKNYKVSISTELAMENTLASNLIPPGYSLSYMLEEKNVPPVHAGNHKEKKEKKGSHKQAAPQKVWEASVGPSGMTPAYGKTLSDYLSSVSGVSGYTIFKNSIEFELNKVHEWGLDFPALYTLTVSLVKDGQVIDSSSQKVGFRDIKMDADRGLFLNGKLVKLNGVCGHHDLGALGAAFDIEALRRKARILKRMGVNAVRTSHNPVPPAYLDLADEMGFLVDSEGFDIWQKHKTSYDYACYFDDWHERDCASWIRQARNHPSVFMWSIGNEIYDTHQGNGLAVTKELKKQVRRWDPLGNAAVTIGSNYMAGEGAQTCAKELDVVGYNYLERLFEEHHAAHPDWKIYGSETSSTVQSRGIYHFPRSRRLLTHSDLQCSCLGNCSTNWGAANSSFVVTAYRDRAFTLGQFIWTGWDYIGEPTPYQTKNSYFGQIDTAGFPKDTYYVYKAGWTDYKEAPFVRISPYWDFNEGQLVDLRAYSNAPCVELFLNGKSVAKFNRDMGKAQDLGPGVQVPYAKGEIKAVAYDERGKEIARDVRKSFGDASRLCIREEVENES